MAKKKSTFWADFKAFALKGNMIDLAIGMIIGTAFGGLVTSLVNNIITPILNVFTGGIDFSDLFVTLDGKTYETLAAAEEAGAPMLKYGAFIQQILQFFVMAMIVFLFVRLLAKLRKMTEKPAEPAPKTTKVCPYCKSEISMEATRCPHCTSVLEETEAK